MDKAEKILNIATKRGFFFPTAEIYNGPAGFWTYGHLGSLMKNKFENLWKCYFLGLNENYFEISGNAILPKKVFESSGHLDKFKDPLTECKKCHFRFRADELIEDELKINAEGLNEKELDKIIKDKKLKCPKCNSDLDKVKWFNMMFELKLGVFGEDIAYLTPESAQNPYLSFKREFSALREKIPMGLAMIGKAFRNEISPRKGFFRLREFTQAELQIFFNPEDDFDFSEVKNYKLRLYLNKKLNEIKVEDAYKKLKLPKIYLYHLAKIQQFYLDTLKIQEDKFRFRELSKEERSFYTKIHFDVELYLETLNGFKEVAGLHHRGFYDLEVHQKGSGENLEVSIDNKKILLNVLELSFGVDRNIYSLLDIFYDEDKERSLFKFPANIAPFDIAIFPLVSNEEKIVKKTKEVYNVLKNKFRIFYDSKGSIGKMYRRADEIGIKAMLTVDFESLNKNDCTLRDRDTMKQIRVKIKDLPETLNKFLEGEKLDKLGKIIK